MLLSKVSAIGRQGRGGLLVDDGEGAQTETVRLRKCGVIRCRAELRETGSRSGMNDESVVEDEEEDGVVIPKDDVDKEMLDQTPAPRTD